MRRLGTVALAFLFLMPAMAGCLEDNDVEPISVNDIVVNPITLGFRYVVVLSVSKTLWAFP